jgi:hypothetical protein
MTTLLAAVATGMVLLTALAGCITQLLRPAELPAALRAHRVLPPAAVRPAAVAAPAAEGLLAAAGAAALLGGSRTGLALVLAAGAGLFGVYAGYSRHALTRAPAGAPCGCAGSGLPLSGWVAGRALTLALLAAAGALLAGPAGTGPPSGAAEYTLVLLIAGGCALLLWVLPAAMHQPAARPPGIRGGVPRWTS